MWHILAQFINIAMLKQKHLKKCFCVRGESRTPDLRVMNPALSPTELPWLVTNHNIQLNIKIVNQIL